MDIYNRRTYKALRKNLRNEATPQERILWSYLRQKRCGYKFVRQYGIGRYIVDFYCPKKRLVIELDGSQHLIDINKAYDDRRTEFLLGLDIQILRFWNNELEDIEAVLSVILDKLNSLKT